MMNNKLRKNEIVLIKDALIVKYEGVWDKKPRPYIIMFESKNYCIGYQITSQRNFKNKNERLLFKHPSLSYKSRSYVKLKHPYIILKNTKGKKIGQITVRDHKYLLKNISASIFFIKSLKEAFINNKNLEINIKKNMKKNKNLENEIER